MAVDDPEAVTISVGSAPMAKATLESTNKEEESSHARSADKKHWATTPAIDIDDCRDGKCDVEDIVDGGRNKASTASGETSTLDQVDHVVPVLRPSVGDMKRGGTECTS
jgi:hypothetical protein